VIGVIAWLLFRLIKSKGEFTINGPNGTILKKGSSTAGNELDLTRLKRAFDRAYDSYIQSKAAIDETLTQTRKTAEGRAIDNAMNDVLIAYSDSSDQVDTHEKLLLYLIRDFKTEFNKQLYQAVKLDNLESLDEQELGDASKRAADAIIKNMRVKLTEYHGVDKDVIASVLNSKYGDIKAAMYNVISDFKSAAQSAKTEMDLKKKAREDAINDEISRSSAGKE
jgi:hypothetical protein